MTTFWNFKFHIQQERIERSRWRICKWKYFHTQGVGSASLSNNCHKTKITPTSLILWPWSPLRHSQLLFWLLCSALIVVSRVKTSALWTTSEESVDNRSGALYQFSVSNISSLTTIGIYFSFCIFSSRIFWKLTIIE